MGIKGLMKLISDEAPEAVKEYTMANYNGRVVAIDASMAIYQFLVRTLTLTHTPVQLPFHPLLVLLSGSIPSRCQPQSLLPFVSVCPVQIAVRSGSDGRASTMLTNEAGEVTR